MNIVSVALDALLVLILVIGMVSGVRRGFVKTVAKPIKLVASLGVAYYVCGTVSEKIIEPFIRIPITNQLRDFMHEKCANLTVENVSTELPTVLKMAAGILGVDVETVAQNSVTTVVDSITQELTDPIIHIVGIIVSFILAYFVAKIALTVVVAIIDAILNVGPLGVINKALGFLFGSAFAFIIAWAFVAVAEFVIGFTGTEVEVGAVYSFFNKFNPLDLLLSF